MPLAGGNAVSLDPLDLLVDAYREETAYRHRDTRILRARVITALGTRRRLPRPLVWLGAAALLFAGSAALAAGGERGMTRLLEWLRPAPAEPPPPPKAVIRHAHRTTKGPTAQASAPTPAAASAAVEAAPVVLELSALPLDEPASRRSGLPASRECDHDLGAELSMFRRAQALHFGGGNPAEALEAWRLYLGEHPRGALAAEARLNEAVCLVKLGRRGEGRRILETLAAENPQSATQRQASELLHVLGSAE
jgi:hypothetical protein